MKHIEPSKILVNIQTGSEYVILSTKGPLVLLYRVWVNITTNHNGLSCSNCQLYVRVRVQQVEGDKANFRKNIGDTFPTVRFSTVSSSNAYASALFLRPLESPVYLPKKVLEECIKAAEELHQQISAAFSPMDIGSVEEFTSSFVTQIRTNEFPEYEEGDPAGIPG